MTYTSPLFVKRVIDQLGNSVLRPPLGGLGRVHLHGSRYVRQIALTFDDGPTDPSTGDILDILSQYKVKATFFCLGENAKQSPYLVERAYKEGHIIGNHSMHHSRKAGLLWKENSHIDDSTAQLRGIIGVTPRLYRPPWGWVTPWETKRLLSRNLDIIGWDVYPPDWKVPTPAAEEIVSTVEQCTRAGSIILFHDGISCVYKASKPNTVLAVEMTIKKLQASGFEFVTVPKLLGLRAYTEITDNF